MLDPSAGPRKVCKYHGPVSSPASSRHAQTMAGPAAVAGPRCERRQTKTATIETGTRQGAGPGRSGVSSQQLEEQLAAQTKEQRVDHPERGVAEMRWGLVRSESFAP